MPSQDAFQGFPERESLFLNIPTGFFGSLLSEIDNLDELKLILVVFWAFHKDQETLTIFSLDGLAGEEKIMKIFNHDLPRVKNAIDKSLARGSLLHLIDPKSNSEFYLLNTPESRAVINKVVSGSITLEDACSIDVLLPHEKENIFRLYEENIGAITPLIAEVLQEDEKLFPMTWIRDAIKEAVEHNVHTWKYVHAILESWQKEGRDGKNRQDPQINRDLYKEKWLGKKHGNG